jgi:tetratricopeptide (TPR) repeat protein
MSLESSQERTEQEQPRSAASTETAHSPTVKENDEGKPLPEDVAPAPVLPNPNDLMALLLTWIRTSDWSTSQTYLRIHPELLTEDAKKMLTGLTQQQPDQRVRDILTEHQLLLQTVRQQGIEAAYQALLHQQEEANDGTVTKQEELLDQVITWLQTSDWEISQTYLQRHPQLLSDATEQIMDELRRAQKEQHAHAVINSRQVLLQKVRVEGIESAYEDFLVSKPEMLINEEVATYQALQDPVTLNEAGKAALNQYLASGQIRDLNRALAYWHKVLKLTPSDSPDRPQYVCNLGIALSACYQRTGYPTDLEAAISAYQQAVETSPPNSLKRAAYLNNLGISLRIRYERVGDPTDLEAAISAFQQALQISPSNSPKRSGYLDNLGTGLNARYRRTEDLTDLEAIISAYQQAVEATPFNSPDRPRYLNNLGISLRSHYERTEDLADLEAAISVFQQTLQISPSNSPDRAEHLNNLASGMGIRYQRTGDVTDLEAAISAFQQAIEATSSNSPNRAGYLVNLGLGLRSRYERTAHEVRNEKLKSLS